MREGEGLGAEVQDARRWRGTIDVPLNSEGRRQAEALGKILRLDAVYHDHLSRCTDTANLLRANVIFADEGPRPWNMGELFEGREITEDSLKMARWFISGNPDGKPPRGESFNSWSRPWLNWIQNLKYGFGAVGVVTHNRNIQYLYAQYQGRFVYKMYDCHGPNFCTVHVYKEGHIAPWGGNSTPRGIYLIRHGATSWGT